MLAPALFFISGMAILSILLAKRHELRYKQTIFVLRLISRGDELVRKLHHRSIAFYSESKTKAEVLFKKQLPLRVRAGFNKTLSLIEEKSSLYLKRVRDSHLIKRSDGISEFFKSISEIEKGAGEINDSLEHVFFDSKPSAEAEPIGESFPSGPEVERPARARSEPVPSVEPIKNTLAPITQDGVRAEAVQSSGTPVKTIVDSRRGAGRRKKKEAKIKPTEPVFVTASEPVQKNVRKRRIKVIEVL